MPARCGGGVLLLLAVRMLVRPAAAMEQRYAGEAASPAQRMHAVSSGGRDVMGRLRVKHTGEGAPFWDPTLDLERSAACLMNRTIVVTGDAAAFDLWAALGGLLEAGLGKPLKARFGNPGRPQDDRVACLGVDSPRQHMRDIDEAMQGRDCKGSWCDCDALLESGREKGYYYNSDPDNVGKSARFRVRDGTKIDEEKEAKKKNQGYRQTSDANMMGGAIRLLYKRVNLLYDGRGADVLEQEEGLPDVFIPVIGAEGLAEIADEAQAVEEAKTQAERLSEAVGKYLRRGDLNHELGTNKRLVELAKKHPREALEQANHRSDPPNKSKKHVKLGNFSGMHQRDRDHVIVGPTGDPVRLDAWRPESGTYGGMSAIPRPDQPHQFSWEKRERLRREKEEEAFHPSEGEGDVLEPTDGSVPIIATVTVFLPRSLARVEYLAGRSALEHVQRKAKGAGGLCDPNRAPPRPRRPLDSPPAAEPCVPDGLGDAAGDGMPVRVLAGALVAVPTLRAAFQAARTDDAGRPVIDLFVQGTVPGMPHVPGPDQLPDSHAWETVRHDGARALERMLAVELGNSFHGNERACPCDAQEQARGGGSAFCAAATADRGNTLGDPCRGLAAGTYATHGCRGWVRCDAKGNVEDEGNCGSSARFFPEAEGSPAGCLPAKMFAVALEPSNEHVIRNESYIPPHPPPYSPPAPPAMPGAQHEEACPEKYPFQHHDLCWPFDVAAHKASHPPRVLLVEAGVPCVQLVPHHPRAWFKKLHRKRVATGELPEGFDRRTMASRAARANEVAKTALERARVAPMDRVDYVIDHERQFYASEADAGHLETHTDARLGTAEDSVRVLGGFGEANDLCASQGSAHAAPGSEVARAVQRAWARRLAESAVRVACGL